MRKGARIPRHGSLGFQLHELLKAVFRPGFSRHKAKELGLAPYIITGIGTMRRYVRVGFSLARFVKAHSPDCRRLEQITPAMCSAYIESMLQRGLSDGYIGSHQCGIQKLDNALRYLKRVPADAPRLMPSSQQAGQRRFRAATSTEAYTAEAARAILAQVRSAGSRKHREVAAQVLELIMATGLRISEAVYLQAGNIDLETRRIELWGNPNRTKGGRPRVTEPFDVEYAEFMGGLKTQGEQCETGHVFANRGNLGKNTQDQVWRACVLLKVKPLGCHGFRKYNAQTKYRQFRCQGMSDQETRLRVARHLGHNRIRVTRESYIPPQDGEESGPE